MGLSNLHSPRRPLSSQHGTRQQFLIYKEHWNFKKKSQEMPRTRKLQEQESRNIKNIQTSRTTVKKCQEHSNFMQWNYNAIALFQKNTFFRRAAQWIHELSTHEHCPTYANIFHPNISSLKHHVHQDRIIHKCVIYHNFHLPIRAMGRKLHFVLLDKRHSIDDQECLQFQHSYRGLLQW